MSIRYIRTVDAAAKKAAALCGPYLHAMEGCGWFDGGCYTFAVALNAVIGGEVCHVSRAKDVPDHAVVKLPGYDLYVDAGGVKSRTELLYFMRSVERCAVTDIYAFPDIADYPLADLLPTLERELRDLLNMSKAVA